MNKKIKSGAMSLLSLLRQFILSLKKDSQIAKSRQMALINGKVEMKTGGIINTMTL